MAPVQIAVVGAGQRGAIYAEYAAAHPTRAVVVAVAEPNAHRRAAFAARFGVPKEGVMADWTELVARGPGQADAVLVCVQDAMHADVAVACAALKYHILLEKPMAVTLDDCLRIFNAVEAHGVMLAVGHVLRYTPLNRAIRDVVLSGALGRVVNVQHLEPIGFYHFAHSYVRGNWRNERLATFSLMAKSCHDIDLISYFLDGVPCTRVSSFGSLAHFGPHGKPPAAGAAKRCVDCAHEPDCAYSAKKIYLEPLVRSGHTTWPVDVITDVVDIENVERALAQGPYGRCVYECDNDVVDTQVVNLEYVGGQTASFTMTAFTRMGRRKTRIHGTLGELSTDGVTIDVYDFATRTAREVPYVEDGSGHGGGDHGLMAAFVDAVAHKDPSLLRSGPWASLSSHLLVFAAEQARRTSSVVPTADFFTQHGVPRRFWGGGGGASDAAAPTA